MIGQELTKKKRIRAGHKSSVTRIITQVKETLEVADWNAAKLKQHLQLLTGKQDIPNKLDVEILEALETEDKITGEIELVGIFNENVTMTIINLETTLGEQQSDAPSQAQTRDRNKFSQENGARPETPNSRDTHEGTTSLPASPSPYKFVSDAAED